MSASQLALFIVAGLILNLTPGPDVFYIVANALRSGLKAGAVAALGIVSGCFVHIFAAAVGLSALIAASASLFSALKLVGAAYLVYVGARMFLTARPAAVGATAEKTPLPAIWRRGFLTNALNPKVALFFLAFVPQFISHDAAHPALDFLMLGLLFNFNSLIVNLVWAAAAAFLAANSRVVGRAVAVIERVAGGLFIVLGCKLAFAELRH